MRVYLDTSFISRVSDLRLEPEDAAAYPRIARFPGLALVTSTTIRDEISRTPDPKRRAMLQFLYSIFEEVPSYSPSVSAMIGGSMVGETMLGGGGSLNPLFASLLTIFERDDALHIFNACQAECDYFLTLDRSTILDRAAARTTVLRGLCPTLKIVSPRQLIAELEALVQKRA